MPQWGLTITKIYVHPCVVGKVYGRLFIKRAREKKDKFISEMQGAFRRGRGCADQVFMVRQHVRSI